MVTFAYDLENFEPSRKIRRPSFLGSNSGGFSMMRIMISAIAVVALIGITVTVLRSRPASIELSATTAAMPSLLELHTMADVNTLPTQEMEDQSLVYPTVEKR
jgi:hypothetical protein